MLNNVTWGRQLSAAYKSKTGDHRGIRLPVADYISFDGDNAYVRVTMENKAICSNMQTNVAAFEAWCLALRVWCGVDKISLIWKKPSDPDERHYQRFLYRANCFSMLFPDWFSIFDPALLGDSVALRTGPLYLNVPGRRSRIANGGGAREAKLEQELLTSSGFKSHFGLGDKVERQIPVGLFKDHVSHATRVFTGGKSAVDILAVANDTLWVFELKAGNNIPAGILSELLFYSSVMSDAIGPNPRFVFKRSSHRGLKVESKDIQNCSMIEAVFLGENLHPLIGHPEVITCINDGTRQSSKGRQTVPVRFRAVTLRKAERDYAFDEL